MKEKEKLVGNAVRQEKSRKRAKASVATLILLAVLVVILIATGAVEKMSDTENLSKEFAEFLGIETQESGFPVSFSTNDIMDVKTKGDDLYVLTKKFVTPVNKKGQTLQPQQITYAQPALKTNGDYAIVFDRLSNKYILRNKKGEYEQRQDANGSQILDAAVTQKGEVMLSLSSTSSSSILHPHPCAYYLVDVLGQTGCHDSEYRDDHDGRKSTGPESCSGLLGKVESDSAELGCV